MNALEGNLLSLLDLDPEDARLLVPAPEAETDPHRLVRPGDPDWVDVGKEHGAFELPEEEWDGSFGALLRGGYEGARTCTGAPEPGTKNLMAFFIERHGSQGGKNLGIYNCRTVRGARTTSVHGEGRAGDHGCTVGNTWMSGWVQALVDHSAELGIQCAIWNRRIWSSSYPDAWRPYGGVNAHVDHAHVEQTRHSARTLTLARIREVLGSPAPRPPVPTVGRPVIMLGSKGVHVGAWQGHLARNFPAYRHESAVKRGQVLKVDNDFGAWTDAWTRLFQKKSGLRVDGKVGPATWRKAGIR